MENQNLILVVFSAFFVALIISYFLTPYAKKLAYKIGAIDVPKDNRRVHKEPIPRLGGVAIFGAFAITTLIITAFGLRIGEQRLLLDGELRGILLGVTLILMVGIVDDVKQISAKYKLVAQIVAALIAVYSGVRIEFITFPFGNVENGLLFLNVLSIPITIFWIVGITNTVNLIDGLDGLAAGVSLIAALSLAVVAAIVEQYQVAVLLAILAGSSLGFLPYNFNPAQIFMGDTGALSIGFLLATISVEGVIKSAATIAVAVPVLALGVPIFDTTFAIIRRLVNKRPIMEADKGHLHHRLLDRGLTQKQTVLTLYFISMLLGGSAILISDTNKTSAHMVIGAVAFLICYGALRIGLVKKTDERKANM